MLGNPGGFTSGATALWDWLDDVVNDGTFTSTRP
jgi:hypothetical protein